MNSLATLVMNVLTISLTCSAVLLPLLLLAPRIRRRVAARSFHVLFLLLALRLLAPVRLTLPKPAVTVEAPDYTITLPAGTERPSEDGDGGYPAIQAPALPTQDAAGQGAADPVREISLTELLGAVWLAGAGLCLIWGGTAYLLARRRLLRDARPAGAEERALLEELAGEKGLARRPALVHSSAISGPLMLGLFRPVIVLPPEDRGGEALRLVLLHELTHLRRRDVAYKAVLSLACAVHWFNPLVWLMSRAAGRNLELCCDDAVVRDMDQSQRCRYGSMLLDAAEQVRPLTLSTRFGGGKGQLKERLTNLFAGKKRGSAALVCLCLGTALLAGGLVACESGGGDAGRRAQLRAWLEAQYPDGLYSVALTDLTGDGAEEMIVITLNDQDGQPLDPMTAEPERFNYGSVAVCGVVDGEVTLLHEQLCSASHAGWGYSYLCPNAEGGPALLAFAPSTGQGFASYSYTLFRFDEDGAQLTQDSDSVEFVVDAANPMGGGMEEASRAEVEDFLAKVEDYRADAVPLLVYNEPYDSSMGSPDLCWLAASADDAFGASDGNYLGQVVGQDGQVSFAIPAAAPGTPEEALAALEDAVRPYGDGYVFRLPSYDGDWTIQVAGRMAVDGENYMSIHFLEEVADWEPGKTYSFETGDGYYSELTLFAAVTAPDGRTAELDIPLITEGHGPHNGRETGGSDAPGARTPDEAETQTVTLYVPNANADGFDTVTAAVPGDADRAAQAIVDALIDRGALPEGVKVNSLTMEDNGLHLDLNEVYRQAVSSAGATGETMLMGSVVNTFLMAYEAETVTLTCDGAVIETGHAIYAEPMGGQMAGATGPDYDVNHRKLMNFLLGFADALLSGDQERAASLMADPAGVSFPEEDVSDQVAEISASMDFEGDRITSVCQYTLRGEDAPRTLTMTVEDKWASGTGEGYAVLAFAWGE